MFYIGAGSCKYRSRWFHDNLAVLILSAAVVRHERYEARGVEQQILAETEASGDEDERRRADTGR